MDDIEWISISQMAQGSFSEDPQLELVCTVHFRKLLSSPHHPPIDAVIDTGVVPRWVEFLVTRRDDHMLLHETLWCLTNICSGTPQQTKIVIQCGAVPHLIDLMLHDSHEIRQQAVWTVGNIAGSSVEDRDLLLKMGAMTVARQVLESSSAPPLLKTTTWTVSNLCRGEPKPYFEIVVEVLPVLARILQLNHPVILCDACWALRYISGTSLASNANMSVIVRSGVKIDRASLSQFEYD